MIATDFQLRTMWLLLVGSVTALAACDARPPAKIQVGADDADRPMALANGATRPANLVNEGDAKPARSETIARLVEIGAAIRKWRTAPDLATAKREAETVRNLVVGPDGPKYGDADRDGTIGGRNSLGLLPGLTRSASLATDSDGHCVARDVMGGSWANPAKRWSILARAIADWRAHNNSFPKLPSHPQRIVGWATLTLATGDVVTARDYGGHAQLHIDVSRKAYLDCKY